MAVPSRTAAYRPRPRRRSRLLLWIVVVCVVAIVAEIGVVTNFFGLEGAFKKGGSSGSSGPNPNPYGELVTSVVGSIVYSGGTDPFPSLAGSELCAGCPVLPKENSNVSPPVAELWVYFNVTFTGSIYTTISNFTLTTSGSNSSLFVLLGVYLYPQYSEAATTVGFTPGQTMGLGIHAMASSIPNDGSTGYALTLHLTSP